MIRQYDQFAKFDVAENSFFEGTLNLTQKNGLKFDPLLTGYAAIFWIHVPEWVKNNCKGFANLTERNFKSLQGIGDIEIGSEAYQYGFANNEYNVAAGITKANTEITLKHQEYSGSPIKNMYQFWASGIRDPETGIATYPLLTGGEYGAKYHTGELLYVMFRPDVNNFGKHNIEFAAYFTNVWPTKIPLAHLNYDQADKSLVDIEIPLKCNMHISKFVDAFAKNYVNKMYQFRTESLFSVDHGDLAAPYNTTRNDVTKTKSAAQRSDIVGTEEV